MKEGKTRQRNCMKEGTYKGVYGVKRDRMRGGSRQRNCMKEGT
jgi:hypothetical protein